MTRKILLLDGACFSDVEGFYEEAERVFTKNLNWKPAHNLDAFNDLLYGGFGMYESREPIILL